MKRIFVNAMIFAAITAGLTAASASAQIKVGGYKTASTTDERVVAAAEFAVSKKAEEQEGLTLDSIEKAETQTVAGTNFRLCLKVSLDDETQEVRTIVYQNLKREYSLTSWKVESCGENESDGNGYLRVSTGSGNKSSAIARCLGEQLSLREVEGEADMGGKRYGNYVFKNISSKTCTLSGYPNFVLLNKAGQPLGGNSGVKVEYANDFVISADENQSDNASSPSPVTLAPGETAWFQIFYNDGMALERKKPFPVSAKVKVIAPNTTRAFVLNSKIQTCCGVQVSLIRGGLPQ